MQVGDKVRYQPKHYGADFENGMVKEIPTHTDESVRVVYNCNNDWDNYRDYTSALTNLRDLKEGWIMKLQVTFKEDAVINDMGVSLGNDFITADTPEQIIAFVRANSDSIEVDCEVVNKMIEDCEG